MTLKFRPHQDYLLVKPLERKKSDILTVISSEKHCRGEVIAVGPGKKNKHGKVHPLDSKVGDIIAFGDGNFDFYPSYREDGIDYRIIQEADVAFVIEAPTQEEKYAA